MKRIPLLSNGVQYADISCSSSYRESQDNSLDESMCMFGVIST